MVSLIGSYSVSWCANLPTAVSSSGDSVLPGDVFGIWGVFVKRVL